MKLYIDMTKSNSLASSIVLQLIFVIHLVNGAQFVNATLVAVCPIKVMSPLT